MRCDVMQRSPRLAADGVRACRPDTRRGPLRCSAVRPACLRRSRGRWKGHSRGRPPTAPCSRSAPPAKRSCRPRGSHGSSRTVLHYDGRKAKRRLVEQQQLRLRQQAARDGEHLLLSAGQAPAERVGQPLQVGEDRVHLFHFGFHRAPRDMAARRRADHDVFLDRQAGKNAASFGYMRDAHAGRFFRATHARSATPSKWISPRVGATSPE